MGSCLLRNPSPVTTPTNSHRRWSPPRRISSTSQVTVTQYQQVDGGGDEEAAGQEDVRAQRHRDGRQDWSPRAGTPPQAPAIPRPIRWLQDHITLPAAFDPSRIGDPVAMKTEWSPMTGHGGNLRTHKLVEVDPDRLGILATTGGLMFALAFLVLGVLAVSLMLKGIVSGLATGNLNLNTLAPLVGFLFPAVGGYLLYSWTTPIVFDRRVGKLFWKGWTQRSRGPTGPRPGTSRPSRRSTRLAAHANFRNST